MKHTQEPYNIYCSAITEQYRKLNPSSDFSVMKLINHFLENFINGIKDHIVYRED